MHIIISEYTNMQVAAVLPPSGSHLRAILHIFIINAPPNVECFEGQKTTCISIDHPVHAAHLPRAARMAAVQKTSPSRAGM